MASLPRVVFIGVIGPSGSGKSTIAAAMALALNSPFEPVEMDYWFNTDVNHTLRTWERPVGLFAEEYIAALRQLRHDTQKAIVEGGELPRVLNPPSSAAQPIRREDWSPASLKANPTVFIVVEGFLLGYYSGIVDLCDHVVVAKASAELCATRRFLRSQRRRLRKEGYNAGDAVSVEAMKAMVSQFVHRKMSEGFIESPPTSEETREELLRRLAAAFREPGIKIPIDAEEIVKEVITLLEEENTAMESPVLLQYALDITLSDDDDNEAVVQLPSKALSKPRRDLLTEMVKQYLVFRNWFIADVWLHYLAYWPTQMANVGKKLIATVDSSRFPNADGVREEGKRIAGQLHSTVSFAFQ